MPRDAGHDVVEAGAGRQELGQAGVVALPVHGPAVLARVPVAIDRGEPVGPLAGAYRVLAEPAGPAEVGEPLPDRPVQRGGVPGGGERAGFGVVGAGRGEVLLERGVGGVPHDAQLFQLLDPPSGHRAGLEGAALVGEPPAERVGTLGVFVRDFEVLLTLAVAHGGVVAALPVLAFGVEDLEADPLRDHHGVARGREAEQQPVLLLPVDGRRPDGLRRINDAFLVLLRDSQHFNGLFIVRPKPFQDPYQGAIRGGGEHVLRLFVRTQEYGHDEGGDFPLSGLLAERAADGLDDVHGGAFGVQEG